MAPNHNSSLSLLIFLITALAVFNPLTVTAFPSPPTTSPPVPSPPSPPPSRKSSPARHPPPPPPSPPATRATAQQLNNIVDALIGSGDFGSWVNIITSANPLSLPLSATIFMPQNDAVGITDPLLFPYHVVPQRLTFADLQLFKTQSRLPTLLPGKSILITNNSRSNFTVDDSPITQPDVYVTTTVAVHGVAGILEYSVYGDELVLMPKQQQQQQQQSPAPPSPPGPGLFLPAAVTTPGSKSGATRLCLCVQFPIGLMVACAVLGFRNQRNYIW